MLKIRIILGIISLIFVLIIFEAIRRRKFMEKYALLWIFSGSLFFVFSIFPELLLKIADITGLYYLTVLLIFLLMAENCLMRARRDFMLVRSERRSSSLSASAQADGMSSPTMSTNSLSRSLCFLKILLMTLFPFSVIRVPR